GQPLDLAIEGEGFFTVIDEKTNLIVYTRCGEFSVNDQCQVVLRRDGREWLLNPQISIPADAAGIAIASDGRVLVSQQWTPNAIAVGQVQITVFEKPDRLRRVATSLYVETAESGPPNTVSAGTQGAGHVLQGALDATNFWASSL